MFFDNGHFANARHTLDLSQAPAAKEGVDTQKYYRASAQCARISWWAEKGPSREGKGYFSTAPRQLNKIAMIVENMISLRALAHARPPAK
jgi:hypothetical protein